MALGKPDLLGQLIERQAFFDAQLLNTICTHTLVICLLGQEHKQTFVESC
jgi:hypothetical protein